MKEMYDNAAHVKDTFNENNLSEYLLQAQWAEFIELKKKLYALIQKKKTPLSVLDIGIGNARILKHLVGIEEIWKGIQEYEGIDIAQNCVDIAKSVIKDLDVEHKVNVQVLDAMQLSTLEKKYDCVISTWFTVGNFYPSKYDIEKYSPHFDMSSNDKFSSIIKQAYDLLNEGGQLILGSVYVDSDETRIKQEESYRNFRWTVTSNKSDCFVATKEGWWSQRFTKERIYSYLPWIPKDQIEFIPLDTYEYAMMVVINK